MLTDNMLLTITRSWLPQGYTKYDAACCTKKVVTDYQYTRHNPSRNCNLHNNGAKISIRNVMLMVWVEGVGRYNVPTH